MKTIVIDLYPELSAKTSILLAFKVYMHKNKNYNLLVVGNGDDLAVLEGVEGVATQKIQEGETSTEAALKALGSGDKAGLISFAPRPRLFEKTAQLLPKADYPSFGLLFVNKKEGKDSLLVEASGFSPRSLEAYRHSLSYGLDYLTKVLSRENPSIGLLGMEENLDPITVAFDEELRQNKDYRGYVLPEDLFAGECDLVLAGGNDGGIALRAAKGSRRLLKDMEKAEGDKANTSKWASFFTFGPSKKQIQEAKRYDARIDEKGYLLFGYPLPIISLNPDSGYTDFFAGIDKLEALAEHQKHE
jgi:hypothetical protein